MIDVIQHLAKQAGNAIMEVRASGILARVKEDITPVTQADERAETLIIAGLMQHFPTISIVAEESVAAGRVPNVGERFFLVDPLDGTKEFIAGRPDFTVNIALIEKGVPVLGIIYAPAHGTLYAANSEIARKTIFENDAVMHVTPLTPTRDEGGARIVASRSHMSEETQKFVDNTPHSELVSIGSSLKFCVLAEGKAEIYPRFGRTMEWDTAAGDAILRAVGGCTKTTTGELLTYGKPNFENPFFIATTSNY